MNARDIMTPQPITLEADDTVATALRMLYQSDVRHLPIVDAEKGLVGMVSDRDLRGLLWTEAESVGASPAAADVFDSTLSELMQSDVVTVAPDAELDEVLDVMLEHRVGAVPVVDGPTDELVGIISYVDVLRAVRQHRLVEAPE